MGARVDIASVGGGPSAWASAEPAAAEPASTGSGTSKLGGNGGASEPGAQSTQRRRPSLNQSVRPEADRLQRTPRWTTSPVAPSASPSLALAPPPPPLRVLT